MRAIRSERFSFFSLLSCMSLTWQCVFPNADVDTLDVSRFDAAPLIAFIAAKEMNYGTETDRRVPR